MTQTAETASGFYYRFEPNYFRKYAANFREIFRIDSTTGTGRLVWNWVAIAQGSLPWQLIFTARCYASAVLAMALCPSVCPSQVGVLLKRLNAGSRKQHHTIAENSSFRMPKFSAKFHRDHPLRGRQMHVGWVKIGDFRQITGYISKTVKYKHIVSIKVE